MRRARGLGIAVLGLMAAGCDGHRPLQVLRAADGGTVPAAVPLDQLIAGYLSANCQWLVQCRFWPSRQACETDLQPTYHDVLQNTVAAVRAGRVRYDPVAARACFAAVRRQTCTVGASAPECATVFDGTIPDGEPCVVHHECRSRRCGADTSTGCCRLGTCLPRATAGAPCSSNEVCLDGLYCASDVGGGPDTCQPLAGIGQRCSTQVECDPALQCDRGGSGTCIPPRATDEPCASNGSDCDRLQGFCAADTGRCQPWRDVGQSCAFNDQDRSGTCVRYAACADGVCVELPGLGKPCQVRAGANAFDACRAGSCIDGTCQEPICPVCTVADAQTGETGRP